MKNAKDILQSLKSNLERESQISEDEAQIHLHSSGERATIAIPVEGKIRIFEVWVKDHGIREGIAI